MKQSKFIAFMQCIIFALCWFNFGMMAAKASPVMMPTDGTVEAINITNIIEGGNPAPLFAVIGAGTDPNDTVRIPLNFDVYEGTIFDITGDQIIVTEVAEELGGGWMFEANSNSFVLPTPEFEIAYFDELTPDWHTPTGFEEIGDNTLALGFNPHPGDAMPAALLLIDVVTADIPTGVTVNPVPTVTAVPIPPAAWLFGSGLIGMVGVARRK